jgi:hypothetical protein
MDEKLSDEEDGTIRPSPSPGHRQRLADQVNLPSDSAIPQRELNRELVLFAQSEHFKPVIRALKAMEQTMLRKQEHHVESGNAQGVTWYGAAFSGLRGARAYFQKHAPNEET